MKNKPEAELTDLCEDDLSQPWPYRRTSRCVYSQAHAEPALVELGPPLYRLVHRHVRFVASGALQAVQHRPFRVFLFQKRAGNVRIEYGSSGRLCRNANHID